LGSNIVLSEIEPVESPGGGNVQWLLEAGAPGALHGLLASRTLVDRVSPYQRVRVYETQAHGRVLMLDDAFMCTERDEFFYHEALIHPNALTHSNPRSALIIGGGDGGSVRQLCKHSTIKKIVLVEIDGLVIDTALKFLGNIHGGMLNTESNSRLSVHIEDGAEFLRCSGERWDLLVLDLTDPAPLANELYGDAFYGLCAQRLAQNGLLSLQVASPVLRPDIIVSIVQKLRRHFKIVAPYLVPTPHAGGLWMMISASHAIDPRNTTASMVNGRMTARGILDLQYYCPDTHLAMFAQPPFIERLVNSA
jgi:spermidine synthase